MTYIVIAQAVESVFICSCCEYSYACLVVVS